MLLLNSHLGKISKNRFLFCQSHISMYVHIYIYIYCCYLWYLYKSEIACMLRTHGKRKTWTCSVQMLPSKNIANNSTRSHLIRLRYHVTETNAKVFSRHNAYKPIAKTTPTLLIIKPSNDPTHFDKSFMQTCNIDEYVNIDNLLLFFLVVINFLHILTVCKWEINDITPFEWLFFGLSILPHQKSR